MLAARGEWVTNEKRLLERAGLRGIDGVIGSLGTRRDGIGPAVAEAERLFEQVIQGAVSPRG